MSRSKFFVLVVAVMLATWVVFAGTASANVEQVVGGGVAQSVG